jgi:hypothetical protein
MGTGDVTVGPPALDAFGERGGGGVSDQFPISDEPSPSRPLPPCVPQLFVEGASPIDPEPTAKAIRVET